MYSLLFVFSFLFTLVLAQVPANVTIVTVFINCTQDLGHTPLKYNVTETGSLMLTPEGNSNNSKDYDLKGLRVCIQLLGPIFDVHIDFGQATYHPDAIMLPFVPSAAAAIVDAGLLQREHVMFNRERPDMVALGEVLRDMAQNQDSMHSGK